MADETNQPDSTVNATPQPVATEDSKTSANEVTPNPATSGAAPSAPAPAPVGPEMVPPSAVPPSPPIPQRDMKSMPQPAGAQQHPAVKRAGILNAIGESLAGGPRYTTTIDPNTGTATRTRVPLSGREIGMAIALEALTGGLSGLGAHGPNHIGEAAARGLQQGQQIKAQRQREQAEEDQRANADFQRASAVTDTNFRMHANAVSMASAERGLHQMDVDTYASTYKLLREAGAVRDIVDESDLGKYNVTKDAAVPVQVVERIGADGKPVLGQHGEPLYDKKYAIIDPNTKIDLPDDVRKLLVDNKIQGYVDGDGKAIDLPKNLQLRAQMVVDGVEKANTIRFAQHAFDGYANAQHNVLHGDTAPVNRASVTMKSLFTDAKGGTDFGRLADAITKHEGGKPGDRNMRNNNPGDLVDGPFVKSQAGYEGSDGTYAKFKTAEDGRNALVAMLQRDVNGKYANSTPEQYVQAVYSPDKAPGNKPGQARAYADDLIRQSGKVAHEDEPITGTPVKLNEALKSGLLSMKDLEAMQRVGGLSAFLNGKPGDLTQAEKMAEQDKTGQLSQSVGRIKMLLDKVMPIDTYREQRARHDASVKTQEAVEKEQALAPVRAQTAADTQAAKEKVEAALPPGTMSPEEAMKEAPVKGVRQNFFASLPAEDQSIIQAIGEGRDTNVSPYALGRSPQAKRIKAEVNLAYPDYDFSKAPAFAKMRDEFTSGKTKDGIDALNTAIKHMKIMYDNAGFITATPVIGAMARQAGYQPAIDLADSKAALVDELGRAYKAGALTIEDKKTWEGRIDKWSPLEIRGNAVAFMKLLDGKLSSYASDWKRGVPSSAVKPIQIMDDQAAEAYQQITGHGADTYGMMRGGGAAQANQWTAPQGAPSATGQPDGAKLKDGSGKVVAIVKGGQWQNPQQ